MARYYNSTYSDYLQYLSLPITFFFFLAVLFLFLIITWYINYEFLYEDLMNQIKLSLMILPVLLLLILHWLSVHNPQRVPFAMSLPKKDALHRAGGSPWGVAILLVFLMFMITHRASLQERWIFNFFSVKMASLSPSRDLVEQGWLPIAAALPSDILDRSS
ncbi:uncharacterized protein LOC111388985 [Olea europaea var. sylvestris]|uniref:uncharacterized protein LOC111388985 n=1 Tax=Olea europaea var. sylvestris TaxID=158386 RepID=UPI000C1D8BE3|nr:uncharacterized protein LOC111388985 [Olea europaea var. sylvestris]